MAQDIPFSFHCMICFEEFTPEDRYPVVLPCGHTYVCSACSARLDKCMECRTPLYIVVSGPATTGATSPPIGAAGAASRSSWSSRGRVSASPSNNPPPVKRRLPLPKNLVLLSLIEATTLASEDVRNSPKSPNDAAANETDDDLEIDRVRSLGSMIDVEDVEEEKIKMGTSFAFGVAGTYAVADREGLEIYPTRPVHPEREGSAVTLADQDVENLVRFYNVGNETEQGEASLQDDSAKKPAGLSYGDRVQIVSIEDGWAKLARGYGYIRADTQQLVKVGNCLDRSCQLEAALRHLSKQKKELRMQQSQVDNQFIRMMNSLQASLQNDEDLTVIVADTFSTTTDDDTEDEKSIGAREPPAAAPTAQDDCSRKKPTLVRQTTPPSLRGFGCFSGGVFDSGSQALETSRVALPDISASALYDAIVPRTSSSEARLMTAASHPSASAMRAGAQAWREQNGQPAAQNSNNGINFRTGMSSHMGLLSTHARHPHDYLNRGRFRMSSHTGLTTTRSKPPGVTLGSITSNILRPRSRDETQDRVPLAGSM